MAVPQDMTGRTPSGAAPRTLAKRGGPSLLPTRIGGAAKILAMGGLLAGLVFVMFFYDPNAQVAVPPNAGMDNSDVNVPVPELDGKLLAAVADAERKERLTLEEEPFRHLLTEALNVTPTVGFLMGRPDRPIPLEDLRLNPTRYRGQWIYYKGTLESLSSPQRGHPVRGYSRYEAVLRIQEDKIPEHRVVLHFSLPPDPGLQEGDYVEAAGFFLKLLDANLPLAMDQAPVLVGRRIRSTYPDRAPVAALDTTILAKVEDEYSSKGFSEGSDRGVVEEQREPLWHLASYAENLRDTNDVTPWANRKPFQSLEEYYQYRDGLIPQGTPVRILGSFIKGRKVPAAPNPFGFQVFSEVWIQLSSWGGKLVPVWIPGQVPALEYNDPVEVRGFFFKDYTYEPYANKENRRSARIYAPAFVAGAVEKWQPERHPVLRTVGWVFAAFVGVITLLFIFVARSDKRSSARNHAALVARRRKRRQKITTAAGQA